MNITREQHHKFLWLLEMQIRRIKLCQYEVSKNEIEEQHMCFNMWKNLQPNGGVYTKTKEYELEKILI